MYWLRVFGPNVGYYTVGVTNDQHIQIMCVLMISVHMLIVCRWGVDKLHMCAVNRAYTSQQTNKNCIKAMFGLIQCILMAWKHTWKPTLGISSSSSYIMLERHRHREVSAWQVWRGYFLSLAHTTALKLDHWTNNIYYFLPSFPYINMSGKHVVSMLFFSISPVPPPHQNNSSSYSRQFAPAF